MSILIKGMEAPTSCKECVFKSVTGVDRWKCRVLNAEFMSWYVGWGGEETRREDCPLVPVPDHGDLIDLNAPFEAQYYDEMTEEWTEKTVTVEDVLYGCMVSDMPPVVIPADPD